MEHYVGIDVSSRYPAVGPIILQRSGRRIRWHILKCALSNRDWATAGAGLLRQRSSIALAKALTALQMLVRNIVLRNARHCRGNPLEDVGELTIVQCIWTDFLTFCEPFASATLKSRRTFKRAAVELIWIFQRNLSLVDD